MLAAATSESLTKKMNSIRLTKQLSNMGFTETFLIDEYSEYIPSPETGFDSNLIQPKQKKS